MVKVGQETRVVAMGAAIGPTERLPYTVELWDLPRLAAERVVGRAASIVLARAIFLAAQKEHLGRRIVLRRGSQVLDTAG